MLTTSQVAFTGWTQVQNTFSTLLFTCRFQGAYIKYMYTYIYTCMDISFLSADGHGYKQVKHFIKKTKKERVHKSQEALFGQVPTYTNNKNKKEFERWGCQWPTTILTLKRPNPSFTSSRMPAVAPLVLFFFLYFHFLPTISVLILVFYMVKITAVHCILGARKRLQERF